MPEILWKAYIDFEVAEGERERARELYERLIQLSGHVKVWIAFALFEGEAIPVPRDEREDEDEDEEGEMKTTPGDVIKARGIFQRAYSDLKSKKLIDEVRFSTISALFVLRKTLHSQRVALLEVWKTFEEQHGSSDDVAKVEQMKPIISKRRRVDQENGQMVEGNFLDDISIPLLLMNPSFQNMSSCSQMTKRRITLPHSSFYKPHTHGKRRRRKRKRRPCRYLQNEFQGMRMVMEPREHMTKKKVLETSCNSIIDIIFFLYSHYDG
jgi:hypothetical protein